MSNKTAVPGTQSPPSAIVNGWRRIFFAQSGAYLTARVIQATGDVRGLAV